MSNDVFEPDTKGLRFAVEQLVETGAVSPLPSLPGQIPAQGVGSRQVLERLAPWLLEHSADLGAATAFAHMDPPTPWVSWATTLWTASRNQNLLHPATAPTARQIE